MYAKTAVILAAFVSIYVLLVFVATAWWHALPLAVALGLTIVAIGFNIMHDANHEAFSERQWVNRAMMMTLDLVGGSSHFWRWKHNVFHHTFVNVVGYDTDINLIGLGRLSPHQPHAWFHRWQHLYVWLLYGALALKWQLYDDYRLALTGRMAQHSVPRPRGLQWVVFFGGKLLFLSLAFAIPLALHPIWAVAAIYVVTAVVLGIVLAVVFQLAHCVEEAGFPLREMPAPFKPLYDGKTPLRVFGHYWYADKCLGEFVRTVEQKLPHPVLAITGDHASRRFLNERPSLYERRAVPLVLHGPDVLRNLAAPAHLAGSHLDIAPTLVELAAPAGFKYHSMGGNLLDPQRVQVGFGSRNVVIGPQFIFEVDRPSEVSPLPGCGMPGDSLNVAKLRESHLAFHGLGWWRIMKGPEFPP